MFNNESDNDNREALDLMIEVVIPSMNSFDCRQVIEHIRGQWLTPCLEKPREGEFSQTVVHIFQ